ncbi:unnamed protein product, partial [Chrysoparadoxa australica]
LTPSHLPPLLCMSSPLSLFPLPPEIMPSSSHELGALDFSPLLPPNWKRLVQQWLDEDIPSMDIGGFVVGDKPETAVLYGKSNCMLAGRPFFEQVFHLLGCTVTWELDDGDMVQLPDGGKEKGKIVVARVQGPACRILVGERVALNTLSRCSGVATASSALSTLGKAKGWHGMVAGTRKTTPGFRLVEKYGLIVGGAATHRNDLSQMVMLKDNHINSAGSITAAVRKAKRATGFSMKVEVETSTLEDAREAASSGADVVMLDNFGPSELKVVAGQLKESFPQVIVEASGGITSETIADYFSEHVDVISSGSLTQGYKCMDFSLKILGPGQKA